MPRRRMRREDFDALLEFLPLFEDPEFVFAEVRWESGHFPSVTESPEVDRFVEVAHEHGWVYAFDWMDWQAQGRAYLEDPARIGEADLLTLRRLLTLHIRQDRFVTGHLHHVHKEGQLVAILRRLRDLRPRDDK